MPNLTLDTRHLTIYEVSAVFLMTLLFSEPKDTDELRGDVHASLCAWAIKQRAVRDEPWAITPQPIKPVYVGLSDTSVDGKMNRINKRMHNRTVAAQMAMVYLKTVDLGAIPALDPPVRALSLNNVSDWVLPVSEQAYQENVETRQWRPSRPVLHLAMAMILLQQLRAKDGLTFDYYELLWNDELLEGLVVASQHYERLIRHFGDKLPPIDLDKLISVSLAR